MQTFPEGRRCTKCSKPLSIYNPSDKCFRCHPVMIKTIDDHGKAGLVPAESPVVGSQSVCSSRETEGFNRVYAEYHGWGPDHH